MYRHKTLPLLLLLSIVAGVARADENKAPARPADEPLVGLMDGLGDYEMPITTRDPLAQKYFNQGLRLVYAFNHDEAIRAFRAAAKLDPTCAMAHWGISLSLGTNYNVPMDEEMGKKAFAELTEARKLSSGATPKEQAFIEALSARYADPPPAERKALDEAYAAAMRKLSQQFPDDLDGATLFAEAMMDLRPWQLWTTLDGKPEPGTDEILKTLEFVLEKNPKHPGANHFYIHAVEMGVPDKGVAAAERLGALTPGAGHLVHMPAHIFFRLGRYHDASASNEAAIKADEAYIAAFKPEGLYPMMYYPHNIHFLWAALTMEGRSTDAIARATEVSRKISDEMVKEMPMLEAFPPTRLFALVRFGKWNDVLQEPAPDPEFTYAAGIRHYARGLALSSQGKLDEATKELRQLRELFMNMPEEKMAMQHHARDLLAIAVDHLDAALMIETRQLDAAIEKLQAAADKQDVLRYDEPPPWYLPMRQPLGKLLLSAKRPADAEQAFREDLELYPENGWSLWGLEQSLRAQNKTAAADEVHQQFEKAWKHADVRL